jgi:hypothetical protein
MKSALLIFYLLTSSFLFAQDKQMVFRNRKDSSKIFSIRMADADMIKLKDGNKKIGLICGYTDSTVCFKENKIKENQNEIKTIGRSRQLTHQQKQAAILKAIYPDSVNIPYNSIKKIEFILGGDKKYKIQRIAAGLLMISADLFLISTLSADDYYYKNPDAGPPPFIATRQGIELGFFSFWGSIFLYHEACIKTLHTCDWKLKN